MYLLYKYTIEHYHNVVNTPFIFFEKQYLEIKKVCRKQKLVPGRPALKSVERERNTIPPGIYLFVFIICHRQAEDKFSAHAFGADNIDIFIVGLNDFSGNGQAQAGALFILAS